MIFNGMMASEMYEARNSRNLEAGLMGDMFPGGHLRTLLTLLRILYTLFTVRMNDKERSVLKGNVLKLNIKNIFPC